MRFTRAAALALSGVIVLLAAADARADWGAAVYSPLTGATGPEELARLQAWYRRGLPREWDASQQEAAERLYDILAEVGGPELVVEIARSSRHYDLNAKKADYERAGVREYLVIELDPDRIHWFVRRRNRFRKLRPGPDGIDRSEVFPGLWLDPEAFHAQDLDRLIEVLEQGLATAEHAAFAAELLRRGAARKPR